MISMRIENCRHLAIAAAAMAVCLNLFRAVAAPVPIRVSSNGQYFVNARAGATILPLVSSLAGC